MNEEKSSTSQVQSWQVNVVIVLLILLLAVSGFQARNSYQSAAKWEYKLEIVPDASFANTINLLGYDGWELVFARRASNESGSAEFNYEMIFRRPLGQGSVKGSLAPIKGV